MRDEAEPQIVADTARPITESAGAPAAPRERRLWLRLPDADPRSMRRVELLLEMFPGEERFIVYFADTGKKLAANCVIKESLVRELTELFGPANVKVVSS